jgi:hypothetical protein
MKYRRVRLDGESIVVAFDDRALTMRIKALSPTVSLDDARRVTYCAVTTGREMAREWRVIPGAGSVFLTSS